MILVCTKVTKISDTTVKTTEYSKIGVMGMDRSNVSDIVRKRTACESITQKTPLHLTLWARSHYELLRLYDLTWSVTTVPGARQSLSGALVRALGSCSHAHTLVMEKFKERSVDKVIEWLWGEGFSDTIVESFRSMLHACSCQLFMVYFVNNNR